MELDHVFVCVPDLSGAERALAEFGLQFGLHAIHQGQGTANACAFFDNAYLELLAPHDEQELKSPRVRPLALWERLHWRETGASPFGIALRGHEAEMPVKTWPYEAAFLPSGLSIQIVTAPHTPAAPLVFLITPSLPIRLRTPAPHRGAHRRLTRVNVSGPGVVATTTALPSTLRLTVGASHRLELEWDAAAAGESFEFKPALPVTWRW